MIWALAVHYIYPSMSWSQGQESREEGRHWHHFYLLLFVNVSYKLTFALKGCLIYLIVQRVKGELTWVIEQC